jgi:hypothetical protein
MRPSCSSTSTELTNLRHRFLTAACPVHRILTYDSAEVLPLSRVRHSSSATFASYSRKCRICLRSLDVYEANTSLGDTQTSVVCREDSRRAHFLRAKRWQDRKRYRPTCTAHLRMYGRHEEIWLPLVIVKAMVKAEARQDRKQPKASTAWP